MNIGRTKGIGTEPSTNGRSGRDPRGRFAAGNTGGPGNPHIHKVAEYRKAMFSAVSVKDVSEMMTSLAQEAKAGNIHAAKFLISYLVGPPIEYEEKDFEANDQAQANKMMSMIPMQELIDLYRKYSPRQDLSQQCEERI